MELSSRSDRLNTMAALLQWQRETVSRWLDRWARQGLRGLYDRPRCGRLPLFTSLEAEQVRAEVEPSPRQWRQVQARVQERRGKTASRQTRRRAHKNKEGWRWKRCRRLLKSRRQEVECRAAQNRLARLQVAEACGQVDIVYFDTAGFHLIPCVPDAWQPPGVTYEMPRAVASG